MNSRLLYCMFICFFALIVIPAGTVVAEKEVIRKKIYIGSISAKQGASENITAKIRDLIKIAILEKYGTSYKLISDEDVKIMFSRAELLQAAGCGGQDCNVEVAKLISTDEIIYGSVMRESGKIAISLTNLSLGRNAKDVSVKSAVRLSFDESLAAAYGREAANKLMDPNYRITALMMTPLSEMKFSKLTNDTIKKNEAVKAVTFTSDDTAVAALIEYYRPMVNEGDACYADGKFSKARGKYKEVITAASGKLTDSTKIKMSDFFRLIHQRIYAAYVMETASQIAVIDDSLRTSSIVTESNLMNAFDKYGLILKNIASFKDLSAADSSALQIPLYDRRDSLLKAVIAQYVKNGSDDYSQLRFENALQKLETASKVCLRIHDKQQMSAAYADLNKKYKVIWKTGRNYLNNEVESLIQQSEYLNVINTPGESVKIMQKARAEITGPLCIFATYELITKFNNNTVLVNKNRGVKITEINPVRDHKFYAKMNDFPLELPPL